MAEEATTVTGEAGGEQTAATTQQEAAAVEQKGAQRGPDGKFAGKSNGAATEEAPDWRATLPEDAKGWASRYASLDDAMKAAVDGHKKLSSALIRPGKDASPEEKERYTAALKREIGVPEKYDEYKVEVPETWDDAEKALVEEFRKEAFASGTPPAAFQRLVMQWSAMLDRQRQMLADDVANGEVELRKKFGKDYDANRALAMSAADRFGEGTELPDLMKMTGKDLAAALGDRALGNHPALVQVFARVGRATGESVPVPAMTGSEAGDVRARINTIMDEHYGKPSYNSDAVQSELSALFARVEPGSRSPERRI